MAIGDLVPFRWGGLRRLQEDRPFGGFREEMESLHRSIDRLFENAIGDGFGPSLLSESWQRGVVPRMDATEDDKAFRITVELPGMEEKDVAVSLSERVLTIRGEKKEEKEKKEKNYHRQERAYGSFQRVLQLPSDVDAEKITASFKNGVLTIDLPKTQESQAKVKQIPVTHA
jgi:HSP20 family protein